MSEEITWSRLDLLWWKNLPPFWNSDFDTSTHQTPDHATMNTGWSMRAFVKWIKTPPPAPLLYQIDCDRFDLVLYQIQYKNLCREKQQHTFILTMPLWTISGFTKFLCAVGIICEHHSPQFFSNESLKFVPFPPMHLFPHSKVVHKRVSVEGSGIWVA